MTTGKPRRCVACGSEASRPLFHELVSCVTCGLVYYPKPLEPAETAGLYGPAYFRGAEYTDYLAERTARQADFRAAIRVLARWLPAGRRLFEIGCAYGFFLALARRRWQVSGCDVSAEACAYARRHFSLDVTCADFAQVPLRRGEVDAFCLWDTVEHLDTLAACLARMADLLEPGGLVALTTGDIGSWLARCQGSRWRQIHPPTHLWYFSQATISRTLERFGFRVVWVGRPGVWRTFGQVVGGLVGRRSLARRLCTAVGLARAPVWLNTFDLMMVLARRRPDSPRRLGRSRGDVCGCQ